MESVCVIICVITAVPNAANTVHIAIPQRYSAPHTGFGREGRVGRSGGRVGRTGSVGRWGSVGMERSVHGCGGVEGGNGGDGDDGVEGGSIGGAGGEAGGGLFRMRQTRRYELLDGSTVSA